MARGSLKGRGKVISSIRLLDVVGDIVGVEGEEEVIEERYYNSCHHGSFEEEMNYVEVLLQREVSKVHIDVEIPNDWRELGYGVGLHKKDLSFLDL